MQHERTPRHRFFLEPFFAKERPVFSTFVSGMADWVDLTSTVRRTRGDVPPPLVRPRPFLPSPRSRPS